jgi:large subunit ribosomal protein L18
MAKLSLFDRRRQRVRTSLRKRGGERPRLSVHRSGRHIYAQVIDDAAGRTVASASSIDKDVKGPDGKRGAGATVSSAQEVGRRVAERARAAGVTQVVFDRGGFLFHGRVKALADAAREGGLEF